MSLPRIHYTADFSFLGELALGSHFGVVRYGIQVYSLCALLFWLVKYPCLKAGACSLARPATIGCLTTATEILRAAFQSAGAAKLTDWGHFADLVDEQRRSGQLVDDDTILIISSL
jgi:hypothetical protein